MRRRGLAPGLALLASLAGCSCDDATPPEERLDGNVVTGDARIRDAQPEDAVPPDLGGIDADAEPAEVGPDSAADAAGDASEDAEAPDAELPCARPPEHVLTASSAAARAGALAGQIVEIVATATAGRVTCTGAASCQGTCTASISLEGLVRLAPSECATEPLGCRGQGCALVCRPQVLGVPERFRGRLVDGPPTLEVFSILP